MDKKTKIVAGVAGVTLVGIVSYLGYRVFKDLNALDDIDWEGLADEYQYKYQKNKQSS